MKRDTCDTILNRVQNDKINVLTLKLNNFIIHFALAVEAVSFCGTKWDKRFSGRRDAAKTT